MPKSFGSLIRNEDGTPNGEAIEEILAQRHVLRTKFAARNPEALQKLLDLLSRNGPITAELLPSGIVHGAAVRLGGSGSRTLAQVEQDHIRAVLKEAGGHRTRAAAILGISPATLWRRTKTMKM